MSQPKSTTDLAQKYAVVAELGQGGMSIVHLAAARGLGNVQKLVVLKSIRPELITNEKVRQMFMDEARLATRLTHPNIVQTYEVVMLGGRPVMVMEYMEGQSLSSVLRRAAEAGGLPLAMKLRILTEALAGLDHAHNITDFEGNVIGLVHRDVSPQNVFVTYEGHVKILDFGIAKAPGNSAHTEIGELKGKIRYMAPEQMQGVPNLDRRADVFGVGVMMWEALTGKRLWHRSPDVEVFTAVLNEGVPSPRSANPDVHEKLEAICVKALERDPDKRYETCAHMQTDLEQAIDELGLRASSKDTGRVVQELFAEVRSNIRRAIERKLKAIVSLPPPAPDAVPDEDEFLRGELLSTAGTGATPAGHQVGARSTSTKSRLAGVALIGAAALLVVGGTALALRARTPALAPVQLVPNAPAAMAPVALPHVDETIEMHLSAAPDGATLYLDGKPLAANPFVGSLPTDNLPHELRAEANGYVTKSVALSLASHANNTVRVALDPTDPTPHRTKAASNVRSASPRVATVASAPAAPNCDHPFSIDSAGIRHVRQECL